MKVNLNKKYDCYFEYFYSTDDTVEDKDVIAKIRNTFKRFKGQYSIVRGSLEVADENIWAVEVRAKLGTLYKMAHKLGDDNDLVNERVGIDM